LPVGSDLCGGHRVQIGVWIISRERHHFLGAGQPQLGGAMDSDSELLL
jgi:hypothetical protein